MFNIITSLNKYLRELILAAASDIIAAEGFDGLSIRKIAGTIEYLPAMMRLGKIVPTLINGTIPAGLEHYTTLVIQGMDLDFIVPLALISGVMLIRRKPFGYLLSSVIIMKGITMGTALTAMIIGQAYAGVHMS